MIGLLTGLTVVVLGVVASRPLRLSLSANARFANFPLILFNALFFLYWGIGTLLAVARPDLLVIPEAVDYFPSAVGLALVGLVCFNWGFSLVAPTQFEGTHSTIAARQGGKGLVLSLTILFVVFAVLRVYLISTGYYLFGAVVYSWGDLSVYLTSAVLLGRIGGLTVATGLLVTARRLRTAVAVVAFEIVLLFVAALKGDFIVWSTYFLMLFVIVRGVRLSRTRLVAFVFVLFVGFWGIQFMRSTFDINYSARNYLAFANEVVGKWTGGTDIALDVPEPGELFRIDYPHKRIAAVELLAASLYMVHSKGYSLFLGETIAEGARMLIPRVLWPDKPPIPKAEEVLLVEHYGFPEEDRLGTVLSSSYSNFGVLGVIVLMVLYGLALGALWRWSRSNLLVLVVVLGAMPELVKQEQMIAGVLGNLRSLAGMMVVLGIGSLVSRRIAEIIQLPQQRAALEGAAGRLARPR